MCLDEACMVSRYYSVLFFVENIVQSWCCCI